MNRRSFLANSAKAGLLAATAPLINLGRYRLFGQTSRNYSARAIDLVKRSTVIDMLNPLSLQMVLGDMAGEKKGDWLSSPETFTEADLARFQGSGWTVLHIAVGTGSYDDTLRFLSLWNGFLAHHGHHFLRIDSPARLAEVKASGSLGIILGIQNSEHFRSVDDVDFFYNIGQRVSQLTYNTRNMIGNGSTERVDGGISDFGVAVIGRMNKLGMAVDVSHCGDKTTLDAFDVSKRPVLITHSNCRALNPHVRCKSDEAIRKMAASGGVMGITGVRMFVSAKEPTTIENVLDHYDHVAKLVGVEHLGTGSDIGIDGYDALSPAVHDKLRKSYKSSYGFREHDDVEGLNDSKRTFDLAEGLIRRGYSDANIELILGGNFKRVLTEIWSTKA